MDYIELPVIVVSIFRFDILSTLHLERFFAVAHQKYPKVKNIVFREMDLAERESYFREMETASSATPTIIEVRHVDRVDRDKDLEKVLQIIYRS